MPSKGNRILSLRVDKKLLAEVEGAIARANARRVDEPYDLAAWIKSTIRERLDHLRRGRRPRGRRAGSDPSGRCPHCGAPAPAPSNGER